MNCLTPNWEFEFDLRLSKVNSGQPYVRCLKAHIIISDLTSIDIFYLDLFLRHSTSKSSIDTCSLSRTVFEIFDLKFSGFDPDFWHPEVTWGHFFHYSIAIHDFLSNFLAISYRFWDIWLQSFHGLTLTFDPQRSSGVEQFHTIRKFIYDFLVDFYRHHLSISYRCLDSWLQSV